MAEHSRPKDQIFFHAIPDGNPLPRTLGGGRLVAAIACALLFPVAVVVPALVALALVAAVWVALHAYEIIWWREARAQARALPAPVSAS